MRTFVASATGSTTVVDHVAAYRPVSFFQVDSKGVAVKRTRLQLVVIDPS